MTRHRVLLASLVVLVVNDHVLKARWPGPVTGIASDVAGLIVAPLVLAIAAEVVTRTPVSTRTVAVLATIVAVGYASVELFGSADRAYEHGLGIAGWPVRAVLGQGTRGMVTATADRADLLALPAAAVAPWLWARSATRTSADRRHPRRWRGALVVVTIPALLATSPAAEPATTATARTSLVRLQAEDPARAFAVTVRVSGLDEWANVSLRTTIAHRAGEPEIRTFTTSDASPIATLDHVPSHGERRDAGRVDLGGDGHRLGRCEARRTCTFRARVVVEMGGDDGSWVHRLRVDAVAQPADDATVRIDVAPDRANPAEAGERVLGAGDLQPALVLRVAGPDATVVVTSDGTYVDDEGIVVLRPAGQRSGPTGQAVVHVEGTTAFLSPALPAGSRDPDRAGTVHLTALRLGPTAPGQRIDLVPARWERYRFRPASATDAQTQTVAVQPGDTLMAALRELPRPDGPISGPQEGLRLSATTADGSTFTAPAQPALTTIDRCPASATVPCRVVLTLGSPGLGPVELDVMTMRS